MKASDYIAKRIKEETDYICLIEHIKVFKL